MLYFTCDNFNCICYTKAQKFLQHNFCNLIYNSLNILNSICPLRLLVWILHTHFTLYTLHTSSITSLPLPNSFPWRTPKRWKSQWTRSGLYVGLGRKVHLSFLFIPVFSDLYVVVCCRFGGKLQQNFCEVTFFWNAAQGSKDVNARYCFDHVACLPAYQHRPLSVP